MTLSEQTSRPLYRQVADELRERIQRQELVPGGQLPTEARLMENYGVSRNTVRLALGLLRSEGLVITGQGRGSFVADLSAPATAGSKGPRFVRSRSSLDVPIVEFSEPSGAERMDINVSSRPASPQIAERLGLQSGAWVLERRRLLYRETLPSQTADTYLPATLADDGELQRTSPLPEGVAGVLERRGHPIAHHTDEITVRMPSPTEAQELQIATGVPVIALTRTAYDPQDTPVCATVALLPGDRHTLRYDVVLEVQPVPADTD
jgi:GntR family transcriptional regulator